MLIPYEIIRKKRDGGRLNRSEIDFMISGFAKGTLPDYQMAAFLMAIFFKKLNAEETAQMTQAMQASGKSIDLSAVPGSTVDKHSTGGIGDKVSLPLAPLVAAAGGFVPMMSGRGLGHTGGTLDKLEAIPGFNVRLSDEAFISVVSKAGCAIVGQTDDIAPADKKMYAMRDVTATVDTMDLISASILSKKFAAGPKALILDVKTGSGAFMQKLDDSRALARLMVDICHNSGRAAEALITNMDQPLGIAAGNACEVVESIAILRGEGPADLRSLTVECGARMLTLAGVVKDRATGRLEIERRITDGSGLERFRRMVELQGGDTRVIDKPELLAKAKKRGAVNASATGTFVSIDTYAAGMSLVVLGAGRQKADDVVDPAVGADFLRKPGERITAGEPLVEFYYNDEARYQEAKKRMESAITIGVGDEPARTMPLIIEDVL